MRLKPIQQALTTEFEEKEILVVTAVSQSDAELLASVLDWKKLTQ